MQNLQEKARRLSGVSSEEAFALDKLEPSLYERLKHDTFVKLSTEFYNRVYSDTGSPWFLEIFARHDKQMAIQNQYEFFIQRMGGPPLYSQRKGHPALIGRHIQFNIVEEAAARWIEHMEAAMDATPEIDAECKKVMLDFLKHTAYFIHIGVMRANNT
uniref:Globin n=1 Tax=Aplanochytrium stocchinoi TaxID=215587 RepID=A0A7S3LSX9_9STRA|mmetsp:Transcript_14964/g.18512  ORF Transcript_14964/g.18512 Transcript_14964/m.18512 type:complete len:158 (+) Transcript_14964:68-541(+)|eukprot:CAMPEP_0204831574 /NCGR_PEP_ID=MMETSP1346-20131115/10871_1 /ASSEMBLY_ACC=CAM_ASM_000771 /TAXON_ID=215587 /ORGANISM="Aplanochytrium stocchinoi, Strain GSBS06" /LENGTH=157 /DNA_ID=CAMNT_0051962683 /DNA_START=156 /DNA_END=629 /DNA_ORIENTATION=+